MTVSKPEAKDYGEPVRRSCLKCLKRFLSRWAGERVCSKCKGTKDWQSPSPLAGTGVGAKPAAHVGSRGAAE